jgi:hypothetical protein
MVGEIGTVLASLRLAGDMAKAGVGLRDAEMIRSKVIELQSQIINAQTAAISANDIYAQQIERIGSLEKEVANLKAWDAEKPRYELKELAAGVSAYVLKEQAEGAEPNHNLCVYCYADGKKSILQREGRIPRAIVWVCHRCKAEIYAAGHPPERR